MQRISAVVFDLDDTLIDTTGQLLAPAHADAAAAMITAGLPGTIEDVARKRMDVARAHPGESVDLLVARLFGCTDQAIVVAGHKAFYERRVGRLEAFEDAEPVLRVLLEEGRRLFLLTTGHPPTQRKKVELAGLGAWFERMVFVDINTSNKETALAELLADGGLEPSAVVVVGDRIDREIAAARKLGCWAVRVDHGEGRHASPDNPRQQPHYTIPGVQAVPAVLEDIEASPVRPGRGSVG
ncbi:MAG: HAD family hydrolase [Myxococcota bacterium]|nr:HAD family hydrolase [Myxococcota bacterium]